jgi:xanthine dehydrogenase accessory factor
MTAPLIEGGDWPTFGWSDDIRPMLSTAMAAGRPAVLATLFKVEGSAPRGAGAQMLFDGMADGVRASGYFSGDCIEGDVASHAAEVLADGKPQVLHYGMGSPWIDIRLRCGGALHVMVERIAADGEAAQALLAHCTARRQCVWSSDGSDQYVAAGGGPLLSVNESPMRIARRFDPPRRLIISGGDPGALALARLASGANFETILVRPDGPATPPPFPVSRYLREPVEAALALIGIDRWTAFVGATHEDHHDLAACLYALRHDAAWTGMIGARTRAAGRLAALAAAGAGPDELVRLHLSPGIAGLGKAPWEVATGILAEVMQAMNGAQEQA